MRRSELDPSGAVWTLPVGRSKNKRAHEIPLSPFAAGLLSSVVGRDGRDLLFGEGGGAFSGFSKAKAALDKRVGSAVGGWGIHDLRRTAATRMGDLGVLPHVVEAVLNHVSGSRAGVAGTYNRAAYRDEKQAALALWAVRVIDLVEQESARSGELVD